LPIMVDLSWRVKNGNVRSIVFKHGDDGFLSPNPDYDLMRRRVRTALGETGSSPSPSPSPSLSPSPSPSKSQTSKSKTESEDVNRTCAYNAKKAAEAQAPR
jgi:polyisoprenyl-teichoic acid--peptidoglycan teichoic acid transferase